MNENECIKPEEILFCPTCNSNRLNYCRREGDFPVVQCKNCNEEVMEKDLRRCDKLNKKRNKLKI